MVKTVSAVTMEDLLNDQPVDEIKQGEVVTGKVISVKKNEIWVDLGAQGIGVVLRREIGFTNKNLVVGDEVSASIVDPEINPGQALLSLRKAAKDRGWDELLEQKAAGEVVEITPYDANRGGLLVELSGVRGFLPVSQLSAEHYPRVSGADKDEILQRLNSLVGQVIRARILDVDRKENKLIFSEKEAVREDMQKRLEKLTTGESVEGTVTGVVDFGAFVNVNGIEGLIHISEISWDRVDNPSDYLKVGQSVEAKVIAIDKDRLSLSLKQLQEDPWVKEVAKYKVGDTVEGRVTRITPFGAFIQISPAVEALVHVSELGGSEEDASDPEQVFKLHETKNFKILSIDTEARKISLSFKD
ncbi:S1 RNA-binding domain-containing protein [Candidatus Saccharibacteria bacterium]|jgi:small subunit ribosomal protein S1|nr:S1 RNA-binding domain-containing protein [Candidatus Saccharibacteria bacterium]MBP9131860.1 S1 RNA-binding domain-containing protein [Candidatus Saccharibacteria bacterium]